MNYIGVLQERCVKAKASLPQFSELGALPDKTFKYSCSFDKWITEGIGFNKKDAKQKAAKLMLDKIESENLLEHINNEKIKSMLLNSDAVSKLSAYCQKEKQNKPLFSEKPDEDGLLVIECTFNEFKAVGRGTNKKIAKEMSADLVLKHFNIYEYFRNLNKTEERLRTLKNPLSQLNELCQSRKLSIVFKEEHFNTDNEGSYQVTCTVGEFECKSLKNISKREAKMNSAELMLNLLNSITPASSPIGKPQHSCTDESDSTPLSKRVKINN